MRKGTLPIILALVLVSPGCRELTQLARMAQGQKKPVKTEEEAKAEVIKPVESAELARIILRPRPPAPVITKDPFFPVVTITKNTGDGKAVPVDEDSPEYVLKGLSYLGMIRIDDTLFALVKNDTKRGVFSINDQINNLTIKDIFEGHIEFLRGEKIFQLKMETQPNANN